MVPGNERKYEDLLNLSFYSFPFFVMFMVFSFSRSMTSLINDRYVSISAHPRLLSPNSFCLHEFYKRLNYYGTKNLCIKLNDSLGLLKSQGMI